MPRSASGFAAIKDKVVRVPFRQLAATAIPKTVTASFTELEIYPANLGSRIVAMSTSYEYYRVTDLILSVFSSVGNAVHYDSSILNTTLGTMGGIMIVSYEPSDTTRTVAPTTRGQMVQAAVTDCGSFHSRFSVRVPKSVLLGTPLKWWNTTSTGSPTETLVQGLVWTCASNYQVNDAATADDVMVLVSGTIEFKGMIDPTLAAMKGPVQKINPPMLEQKVPVRASIKPEAEDSDVSDAVSEVMVPVAPKQVKWVRVPLRLEDGVA